MLQIPHQFLVGRSDITSKPRSLQNICTFESGLSEFHKMTLTVLKSFAKQKTSA